MIASALAFVMAVQQAGGSVQAVYPEDRTSWTLDYPVRIEPYVTEYYNRLRGGSYSVGDETTFEAQYRQDVPRCQKMGVALEAEANSALRASGGHEATPPDEVAQIFDRARRIHIARGQSLDLALRTSLSGMARDVPVDAAEQAGCIARLGTLQEQRAAYVAAEELRTEALIAKQDYTEADRQAVARYQAQLRRYNGLIALEQRSCGSAARAQALAETDRTKGTTETNAQD